MRIHFILLSFLAIFLTFSDIIAEDKKTLLREGNKLFKEDKFNDAEIKYRKAQEIEYGYKSTFNLGDALYKQGNFEEATQKFKELAGQKLDKNTLAAVYHNLGNSQFKTGNYEESLQSYKNALKLNPKDNDTRYNLELARRMIKMQQQNQQQQNQDNQDQNNQDNQEQNQGDNQDQNKPQDQQQNQQGKDNKDQKNDQNDKQENNQNDGKGQEKDSDKQQGDSKQPRPYEISKEDAERMLNAIQKNEKDLQKKLRKQKGERAKIERNW